jgi:hypothetical protein
MLIFRLGTVFSFCKVIQRYVFDDDYDKEMGLKIIYFIIIKGDTFDENINRHEAFLALKLGLKNGMRVLVSPLN